MRPGNDYFCDPMSEISTLQTSFELGRVLLIDKPLTWTSFNVVSKVRGAIRVKKVGHAGTLDPLATGLLILCTGKFTKRLNEYMGQEKEYLATFTLGSVTPTFDLESQPENPQSLDGITAEVLERALPTFTGDILQVPPIHSAIKQGGKPVYLAARQGKEVKLEPRPVTIRTFEILAVSLPEVDVRVVCTTGTYIRSLANDFGAALGCGAYLSALRRTRIGEFRVEDAQSLEGFLESVKEIRGSRSDGRAGDQNE
jgi:tRNA pseudouridine55 synthase